MMNGFKEHDLDEDNFGAKSGSSIVSAFDAFRKSYALGLAIHYTKAVKFIYGSSRLRRWPPI
jgi:hypothetical protein